LKIADLGFRIADLKKMDDFSKLSFRLWDGKNGK
jgi:hypothetical protein